MRLILSTLIWGICFFSLSVESFAQITESAAKSLPEADYRIQQGDKISVKFFSHPELNEASLTVRPDGFISLQIIDDVKAEGRTATELKTHLEKAYNEILLRPIITVSIIEFVAPRIYIAGQVNKPGRYDLREAETLMQAIFLAGGFTRDANRKMIIRARPDGKGDWQILSANAMKIINKKDEEKDLTLQDGDYIFIPESKISQFNKAVESFRGLMPRFF